MKRYIYPMVLFTDENESYENFLNNAKKKGR